MCVCVCVCVCVTGQDEASSDMEIDDPFPVPGQQDTTAAADTAGGQQQQQGGGGDAGRTVRRSDAHQEQIHQLNQQLRPLRAQLQVCIVGLHATHAPPRARFIVAEPGL